MSEARGLELDTATAVVRDALGGSLSVIATEPLEGGMVTRVEGWTTDGVPRELVVKMSKGVDRFADFELEYQGLAWWAGIPDFPTAAPYAWSAGAEAVPGGYLLMERLPGRIALKARFTQAGWKAYQSELAERVAALHERRGEGYGVACRDGLVPRWVDSFRPMLEASYREAADKLPAETRAPVERLLADLDWWLPETGRPALVHGDLWGANILVDDADPDRPRITGFIDSVPRYADPEYELAYLAAFRPPDPLFYEPYAARRPLREGFQSRRRVYGLNTMLIHLGLFGEAYLPRCVALAREIERDATMGREL